MTAGEKSSEPEYVWKPFEVRHGMHVLLHAHAPDHALRCQLRTAIKPGEDHITHWAIVPLKDFNVLFFDNVILLVDFLTRKSARPA